MCNVLEAMYIFYYIQLLLNEDLPENVQLPVIVKLPITADPSNYRSQ
jgi:hypothetical protein